MPEPAAGMSITKSVRLVRRIGRGSMGSVWIADHAALETQVVVKFMSQALSGDLELVGRFKREAAAASQVKSPHVVQMLDHGIAEGGVPFIIMELLEGRDLQAHLAERGKLPPRDVAIVVAQLAKALLRAHERGIVHRDIKPSNVFLCDVGGGETFVKLLDFGIAKVVSGGAQQFDATQSGVMVGTPHYMSPEQLSGAPLDPRSDVWAIGVLAFRALTGGPPFSGDSLVSLAIAIQMAPLPQPSEREPTLPKTFDIWFEKACARDLALRYPDVRTQAEALAVALEVHDVTAATFAISGSDRIVAIDTKDERGDPTESMPTPHLDTSTYQGASYSPRPSLAGRARAHWGLFALVALVALGGLVVILAVMLWRRPPEATQPAATAPGPSVSTPAASTSVSNEPPPSVSPSATVSASALGTTHPKKSPSSPKKPEDDPFGDHRK